MAAGLLGCLLGCLVTLPSQGLEGVGGREGGDVASVHLQCQVGWLSLYPEQERDFGLRIAVLGSGL